MEDSMISKNDDEVLITEFSVSMHCNACERSVAKAISKIKGVEKFATDMPGHRVIVIGQINAEKFVKKIMKKTGKRAQIIPAGKEEEDKGSSEKEETGETPDYLMGTLGFGCCLGPEGYTIFSDENPNACSVM